jgi:hypothetical protein
MYNCPRCGYSSERKYCMQNHLKRMKKCIPKLSNVNINEIADEILKGKERVKKRDIPVAPEVGPEESSDDESETREMQSFTSRVNIEAWNPDSALDNKIQEILNADEKIIYNTSFQGYEIFDVDLDFVVDFDLVWRWVGYKRKGDAKYALVNSRFLEENVHYIIRNIENLHSSSLTNENLASPIEGRFQEIFCGENYEKAASENSGAAFRNILLGGSGKNREIIYLTITAFKKFCMMAGTEQANKMHDFYIKLERCFYEVRKEEIRNFELLLKNKDTQKERNLIQNFHKKPVVYLGMVGKNIAEFGFSNNIKKRLETHKRDKPDFTLEYCIETIYNRELEMNIKSSPDLMELINEKLKSRIFSKVYNGKKQTEFIRLDKKFRLEHVYEIVKSLKNLMDKDEIIKTLNAENKTLRGIINNLVNHIDE